MVGGIGLWLYGGALGEFERRWEGIGEETVSSRVVGFGLGDYWCGLRDC